MKLLLVFGVLITPYASFGASSGSEGSLIGLHGQRESQANEPQATQSNKAWERLKRWIGMGDSPENSDEKPVDVGGIEHTDILREQLPQNFDASIVGESITSPKPSTVVAMSGNERQRCADDINCGQQIVQESTVSDVQKLWTKMDNEERGELIFENRQIFIALAAGAGATGLLKNMRSAMRIASAFKVIPIVGVAATAGSAFAEIELVPENCNGVEIFSNLSLEPGQIVECIEKSPRQRLQLEVLIDQLDWDI